MEYKIVTGAERTHSVNLRIPARLTSEDKTKGLVTGLKLLS